MASIYSAARIISHGLRYSRHALFNREILDFVSMGLGIEARAERFGPQWRRHWEYSKEFVQRTLEPGESVAILGAGRLYDLDLAALTQNFNRIHLIDVDPECAPSWKRAAAALPAGVLSFECVELTGVLHEWSAALARAPSLAQLRTLGSAARAHQPISQRYDAVVSLNLLSQIGVYWEARARRLLRSELRAASSERIREIEAAIATSVRRLELGHLELLAETRAQSIAVLSDLYFLYYEPDSVNWQEERALQIEEITPAGYVQRTSDSWLWHLVPAGGEGPRYGEIHEVHAWAFGRINQNS